MAIDIRKGFPFGRTRREEEGGRLYTISKYFYKQIKGETVNLITRGSEERRGTRENYTLLVEWCSQCS